MKENENFFGSDNTVNGNAGNSPIYFIGKDEQWQVNPIYKLDDSPDTPNRFVIVKTTANGKYLVGDMIHYNYKGVEIITDSTNAIFVDKINETVFVREFDKALRSISPEDPERRQYVILMVGYDNEYEDDMFQWSSVTGRTGAYEFIKMYAYVMDIERSIVLTDNVVFKDALTVSQFVHYLKNSQMVPDDDFDIDDYAYGKMED